MYEDAGSDIQETLKKAKRNTNIDMRRAFFSPSILNNKQLAD